MSILGLILSGISIGPYMSWDDSPASTIRINWRTSSADSSILVFGIGSLTDTLADSEPTTIHSFKLTGLLPGSTYVYKIIGEDYSTPTYHFRTSPENPDSVVFVVFGDTRSDSAAHQMVVNAIIEANPEFVINTGDLVSDGEKMSEWITYFNIEREMLHNAPLMPCIGNHEYPLDNYLSLFYLPGNEQYYTFEYGNLFFVALNTEVSDYSTQRTFLDSVLRQASQDSGKWLIVYFHRPPYSAGGHGSDQDVRSAFTEIMEQHHVSLVFNGHNHFYQRTVPINGVTYIVSGGGGAPLYDPGSASWIAYSEAAYHYVLVKALQDSMIVRAVRASDGEIIDSFTVYRPTSVGEQESNYTIPIIGRTGVFDITGRYVGSDSTAIKKSGLYIIRDRTGSRKLLIVR